MSFAASPSSVALRASIERLLPLGLFRHSAFKVLVGVGLAFCGVSALKKASDTLSQARLNNYIKDVYDWEREVVVVTGGSGGLGAPLVRKFAQLGATVISMDIVPPKGPLHLTNNANIKEVAAQVRRDRGDPTVLINNAGIAEPLCLLETSEETICRTFNINVISHFILIKEFLPAMVERNHGHIVTVASMRSFTAGPRGADYASSKAAALALHEALSQEVRHQYNSPKIRTSVLHPAFVRTPIIDKVLDYAQAHFTILDPEDVSDAIFKHILTGNSGQLFFPKYMSFLAGVRGWPNWLQEGLRDGHASGIVPYYIRNNGQGKN